jgi:hypothetical protein
MLVDAARTATERLAPDEMPLFEDTARAWLRHGRTYRPRRGDDALGFGLDHIEPVVTVAALTAAAAALRFMKSTAADAGAKGASELVTTLVRRLLSRLGGRPPAAKSEAGDGVLRPSPHELVRVRQITYERLRATGLSADQAALVADAVIGALVTSAEESEA